MSNKIEREDETGSSRSKEKAAPKSRRPEEGGRWETRKKIRKNLVKKTVPS